MASNKSSNVSINQGSNSSDEGEGKHQEKNKKIKSAVPSYQPQVKPKSNAYGIFKKQKLEEESESDASRLIEKKPSDDSSFISPTKLPEK